MIRKQTQPNMAKVATIEFGFGSVHMIAGCKELEDKSIGVLFMDTQEPQEIGVKKPYKQPELVRDCDHEVLMTFENTESIDALISSLQDVKKTMEINKVSNRVEFNARCYAVIKKLRELHKFLVSKNEHELAQQCMEILDCISLGAMDDDILPSLVGECLSDALDSMIDLYYEDAIPAGDTICPEIITLLNRLIRDLAELI